MKWKEGNNKDKNRNQMKLKTGKQIEKSLRNKKLILQVNKSDKPLARMKKKNRRQINTVRSEREDTSQPLRRYYGDHEKY